MQHDDASRIAVLLDDSNRNALALGTSSQTGPKLEALVRAGRKPLVGRHRVKNVESRFARTSNAERPVKGISTCFREIDRTQDLLDRCHSNPHPFRRAGVRGRSGFETFGLTPNVQGGGSSSIATFLGCSLPRFPVNQPPANPARRKPVTTYGQTRISRQIKSER